MKKRLGYLLLFVMILCLSGCGAKKSNDSNEDKKENEGKSKVQSEEREKTETSAGVIIYEDKDVVVREVEILKEPKLAEINWVPIDKETLIKESDLIFEGTIKEIKEIEIQAQYLDNTYKLYKTLLIVSVDKVVSEKEGSGRKDGDITLLVSDSSREHEESVAPMVKGEKYEFIVKSSMAIEDDVHKICEYSDYYIGSPIDEINPIVDGMPLPTMKPLDSKDEDKKENIYDIKDVIKDVEDNFSVTIETPLNSPYDEYTGIFEAMANLMELNKEDSNYLYKVLVFSDGSLEGYVQKVNESSGVNIDFGKWKEVYVKDDVLNLGKTKYLCELTANEIKVLADPDKKITICYVGNGAEISKDIEVDFNNKEYLKAYCESLGDHYIECEKGIKCTAGDYWFSYGEDAFTVNEHRPEGYGYYGFLGSALALKMELHKDTPNYRYQVAVLVDKDSLRQPLNEEDAAYEKVVLKEDDFTEIVIENDNGCKYDKTYFAYLTYDQIALVLDKVSPACVQYVGTGKTNELTEDFNNSEYVEGFCEEYGDMLIVRDGRVVRIIE